MPTDALLESTMRKRSRWAVLSFTLGCLGLALAFTLRGGGQLLALPVGAAAFVSGILALSLIGRPGKERRGRGLAVWGMCLGGMAAVASLGVLASLLFLPGCAWFGGSAAQRDVIEARKARAAATDPAPPRRKTVEERLVEAWLTRAKKRVANAWLAEHSVGEQPD